MANNSSSDVGQWGDNLVTLKIELTGLEPAYAALIAAGDIDPDQVSLDEYAVFQVTSLLNNHGLPFHNIRVEKGDQDDCKD